MLEFASDGCKTLLSVAGMEVSVPLFNTGKAAGDSPVEEFVGVLEFPGEQWGLDGDFWHKVLTDCGD